MKIITVRIEWGSNEVGWGMFSVVFKNSIIMYLDGECVEAGVGWLSRSPSAEHLALFSLRTKLWLSLQRLRFFTRILLLHACCPVSDGLFSMLPYPTSCVSTLENQVPRLLTTAVLATFQFRFLFFPPFLILLLIFNFLLIYFTSWLQFPFPLLPPPSIASVPLPIHSSAMSIQKRAGL